MTVESKRLFVSVALLSTLPVVSIAAPDLPGQASIDIWNPRRKGILASRFFVTLFVIPLHNGVDGFLTE